MDKLFIDIETYSSVHIDRGAYRYVEAPDFMILFACWWYGDERAGLPELDDIHVAETDDELAAIPGLLDDDELRVAHNAAFERIAFSAWLGLPVGTYLSPEGWHDTQAIAAERGYPRSLDKLGWALGIPHKDPQGKRLINIFSRPNRKGVRTLPEERPEDWEAFKRYGQQDVLTMIHAHRKLRGWPTLTEKQVYLADQAINDRGMPVDLTMAWAAARAAEDVRMVQELRVSELTGVINPGSVQQMGKWARSIGLDMPNWREETVSRMLEDPELDPVVREVLELRAELALSSTSKYQAALDTANADSRVRGAFVFHKAHTGRWAGTGAQLHNLPRASLIKGDVGYGPDDAMTPEEANELVNDAVARLLEGEETDAHRLKAMIRAMLLGPFSVADYSSIEARVIAWLADEEWALEAFRADRDIYVETAQRMGGLSRAEGKIAVLALGYNGGVGSLRALGGGSLGDDAALQLLVDRWRAANPRIVSLWSTLGSAFISGGPAGRHLTVERRGNDRRIVLPSGRSLTYHNVRMENRKKTRVNRETGEEETYMKRVLTFDDPGRYPARAETYGGRLCENVTQAIARDVLAESLIRLESNGLRTVGHVHDEIIVEGTENVGALVELMTTPPSWADGLPIGAAAFTCDRYRKG